MQRLDAFTLDIRTGSKPGPERPLFAINGFPIEFEDYDGSTDSDATLKARGAPRSFPHSLALVGPDGGRPDWEIEGVTATYYCANEEPYTVHLGAVTLNDESDLNIWHEPPLPTFDV